ncbi:hypothetical protein JL722_1792 [Aureococcus anophagefferens]|nr:hypothetical protein JL722_1792 [Aureococcus anophagefferens]
MVGPALHASVRVLVNGPTKRAADALGRHADKRMWRKKYPWLKQVRLIVATAACIVHFTVMVMDDKGRAVPSFGVFASVFKDVAAYEAYFLVATSAGQAAVGYINVKGKRLALKVFHRIVGIDYWRNVLVLTWLVNDDQEADETRRRLKTHLLDASALPESTLVAPSPEALRAWLLRHNRSEYVAAGEAARLATNLRARGGAAPWQGDWQWVPGKKGGLGSWLHLDVDAVREREKAQSKANTDRRKKVACEGQALLTCAGCHRPFVSPWALNIHLSVSERCRMAYPSATPPPGAAPNLPSSRGPYSKKGDATAIRLKQSNPKRRGTKAHERYDKYKAATTKGEYRALGGSSTDYSLDLKHKDITEL